jgi:hypothetical protein
MKYNEVKSKYAAQAHELSKKIQFLDIEIAIKTNLLSELNDKYWNPKKLSPGETLNNIAALRNQVASDIQKLKAKKGALFLTEEDVNAIQNFVTQ